MSSTNVKPVPTSEYLAVTKVVDNYIEGLRVGDAKQVAKSFHQDATMYGFVSDGSLLGGPMSNLWTYIESTGPATNILAHNNVLSITLTTAVVQVDMENDATGTSYTDFHSLLKQDGKWLIISKMFHAYA